jgi:urease subunit gamma/beta
VHLSPTEEDRLLVFVAAELARRSLAAGLSLSAPEATALVADKMHQAARRGEGLDGVLAAGRAAVPSARLMDGVVESVGEVRVEVLVDDGRRLAVLRPWDETVPDSFAPGAIVPSGGSITTAEGRERRTLIVVSRSARPIRVSSHYPFWRVNPRLEFDRGAADGFRLDLPAGASLRWAPGETKEVTLVAVVGGG